MMEGYVVYVLLSEKDKRTYTGSTNNLEKRMSLHHGGMVLSTRYRRPLSIIYVERFASLKEARIRERYLKSTQGRRELKRILQK